MDPLQFAMHSDVVAEVLGTIVVLSLIIERALAPIFEWKKFLEINEQKTGLKEPIAMVVSVAIVWAYGFDALAILFSEERPNWIGYLLTGLVVAGGSKGSIALFRGWLGWKSTARAEYEEEKKRKQQEQQKNDNEKQDKGGD